MLNIDKLESRSALLKQGKAIRNMQSFKKDLPATSDLDVESFASAVF